MTKVNVKKKVLLLTKIIGFSIFYTLILIASVFLTMSILIKGEEIKAPDLKGKSLSEAYEIASEKGIFLKKVVGTYDKNIKPLTVITQFPAPGVKIKEKSFIKIYVSAELIEVLMPEFCGYSLKECEKILRDNDLRKRYISYMESEDAPVDSVIAQSIPKGARIPSGSEIDFLVSKGPKNLSYMMPDVIGKRMSQVTHYFESKGLNIARVDKISYPGLEPDIIVKQYPDSGFKINSKARISIVVSE